MRHNQLFCTGVLLGLAMVAAGPIRGQDEPEVVGFSIAAKDPASEFGQSYVPGTQAGLQVYLRVSLPDKTILKVDGAATSLSVGDSTNKKLAANENSDISFFAMIAEDKHSLIVPIQCTELPSSGATFLTISGTAVLNCGADSKTETVDVSVKQDEEWKLGPVTARVTEVGDGFESDSKRVDLESKNSFDQIESLVFLDAAGKEIETSGAGGGSSSFGGDTTYSRGYSFKSAAEKVAKVKISYFQKIDAVKVPVDAKFGFDLTK